MKNIKGWLENYWYHYKWVTVISITCAVALCVCLFQCTKKDEYGMYALYAGPLYIGGEQSSSISDAVNDHMSAENKNVCINSFIYVSEANKELYKENDMYVNEGINRQQTNDFFEYLYTASFNMLILDSELYSQIDKQALLTPMNEISDTCAQKTHDGYCVRLYDTSLPNKYAVFAEMPSDTVLCFRKNVLMQSLASKNNTDVYEYQMSVFKKMIES